MREITIWGRRIADDEPCYVIAELGHNHGGSLDTARQMIAASADAGVSACKLQKRDNATLYSPSMLRMPYENPASFGATYGAHRQALEFSLSQIEACQVEARKHDIAMFATAFDEHSADLLMRMPVQPPAIKIHSGGLTDYPLLRHVASYGVPLILSTGGGDQADIDQAVQTITAYHSQLAILHCTASYPVTNYREMNLRCIQTFRDRYPDLVIGWSCHYSGIALSMMAYTLGARILEHHFTLNRASKGTDHGFSLEPVGMKKLCRDLARAHEAMGDGVKRFYPSEYGPISKMRRWWIHGKWQIGTTAEQETAVRA